MGPHGSAGSCSQSKNQKMRFAKDIFVINSSEEDDTYVFWYAEKGFSCQAKTAGQGTLKPNAVARPNRLWIFILPHRLNVVRHNRPSYTLSNELRSDIPRWSLPRILELRPDSKLGGAVKPGGGLNKINISAQLLFGRCLSKTQGFISRVSGSFSFFRGLFGIDGSSERSTKRQDSDDGSDPQQFPLTIGHNRYSFGSVRRTGLLDEIIVLQAIFLGSLGTAFALVKGFPASEPVQLRWIAVGAAGAVGTVLLLKPFIGGYVWLPWP